MTEGPATHIASALAENLRLDFGGIRRDPFSDFWPSRDFYIVAMPDELRSRALKYLEGYPDAPGDEGTFSFVKLVNIAAGLRSFELYDRDAALAERLYGAARDVAESWAASKDHPSWYCAELVANAYGRSFTRADLTPPPSLGAREDIPEPDELPWVVDKLFDRIERLDGRNGTAARLLTLLADEDRPFLVDAVTAIAQSGGKLFGEVLDDLVDRVLDWLRGDEEPDPEEEPRTPDPLLDPRPMPGLPDPDAPLPYGLVTPRMLWQVFGRDSLCRVRQSSS
ncbi:hypothetical protein [Actinomycetospora sp. NBRC 106375]|uniref:hypothetical protein n=1 Tax=Actinomycetospora sp. NBRC 106375 TaxID=3032207 RepID=UPI00255394CC|nr:hypothetical protein [Actinomycetospora sp. NBRC 106375]